MIVGICFPSPGAHAQGYDPAVLALLKGRTLATHIRINIHHNRPDAVEAIAAIRDQGLEPLPILDFNYQKPAVQDYADFCAWISRECQLPVVELGNEPYTLRHGPERPRDGMRASDYAHVFSTAAYAIRNAGLSTRILVACEAMKAIAKPIDYFETVARIVPSDLYDGLAIHPYRNPEPPDFTSKQFRNRINETNHYRNQSPGKALWVTEVGWDLRGDVDEIKQADYLYRELQFWQSQSAAAVFIYNWTEPPPPSEWAFGVLDHRLQPRPACDAIARFQREQGLQS